MIRAEFDAAMKPVYANYGANKFSKELADLIFDESKNLTVTAFREVVKKIMQTCKFAPRLKDFTDAMRTPIKFEAIDGGKQEINYSEKLCRWCGGTGEVRWTKGPKDHRGFDMYFGTSKCPDEFCDYGNAKPNWMSRITNAHSHLGFTIYKFMDEVPHYKSTDPMSPEMENLMGRLKLVRGRQNESLKRYAPSSDDNGPGDAA